MFVKYEKQYQQGKAAFYEPNHYTNQQQEPVARTLNKNRTGHKAEHKLHDSA
jgi:hypothetical protein